MYRTQMDRIKILVLTFYTTSLLLVPNVINGSFFPKPPGPPPHHQRPLCASQITLVNYACAQVHSPSPSSPTLPSTILFPDRGHRHFGSPDEENCCRWLIGVDNECVCDLLLHLPPFLARPAHVYNVNIGDVCNVTFSCGGSSL